MNANNMNCRMLDAAICADEMKWEDSESGFTYKPNADYVKPLLFDGSPVMFSDGEKHIDAGYVGETTDGYVIVGLRGTLVMVPFDSDEKKIAAKLDWMQDFEAKLENWTVGDEVVGKVETGFARATHSLWPDVKNALDAIPALDQKQGILVAGHSKGAALAAPMASLIHHQYPAARIHGVYAYATPSNVDGEFKSWYEKAGLDKVTTRYQNLYDIIPFVPPTDKINLKSAIENAPPPTSPLFKPQYDLMMPALRKMTPQCFALLGSLKFYDDDGEHGGAEGLAKAEAAVRQKLADTSPHWDILLMAHMPSKQLYQPVPDYHARICPE